MRFTPPSPEELAQVAFRNICAKADDYGLRNWFTEVRLLDVDRFYFAGLPKMLNTLRDPSYFQDSPTSAAHARIYDVFRPDIVQRVDPRSWPLLQSVREPERPSLQVTWIEFPDAIYGDIDIDLSSPLMDVVGFFTHLIEVLVPGPTDHFKLAKRLRKQGYDV